MPDSERAADCQTTTAGAPPPAMVEVPIPDGLLASERQRRFERAQDAIVTCVILGLVQVPPSGFVMVPSSGACGPPLRFRSTLAGDPQ